MLAGGSAPTQRRVAKAALSSNGGSDWRPCDLFMLFAAAVASSFFLLQRPQRQSAVTVSVWRQPHPSEFVSALLPDEVPPRSSSRRPRKGRGSKGESTLGHKCFAQIFVACMLLWACGGAAAAFERSRWRGG